MSNAARWKPVRRLLHDVTSPNEQRRVHMKRLISAILTATLAVGAGRLALGDDQESKVVIDKAVAALGGAAKLEAAKAVQWKTKGKPPLERQRKLGFHQGDCTGRRSLSTGI